MGCLLYFFLDVFVVGTQGSYRLLQRTSLTSQGKPNQAAKVANQSQKLFTFGNLILSISGARS